MAAETLEFPFYIVIDETPHATKNLEDYLSEYLEDEHETVTKWFQEHATEVGDILTANRVLYPWFHDGEPAPF